MNNDSNSSNFLTPKSIDNLSIAGLSVWLLCLTLISLRQDIEAYTVRIVAFSLSLIWSLSLFFKNKRWNKWHNYILIIINAVFIYINAAGINTVTRQSPFEGYGVNGDIEYMKKPILQASFLGLENQLNWYPDYEMIKYIDTLKQNLFLQNIETGKLKNEFSYLKDNLEYITNDEKTLNRLKNYLKDFGKSKIDSTDFAIMKAECERRLDSLSSALDYLKAHPIETISTTYYTIEGTRYTAEQLVDKNFQTISKLSNEVVGLLQLLQTIQAANPTTRALIDSTIKTIVH